MPKKTVAAIVAALIVLIGGILMADSYDRIQVIAKNEIAENNAISTQYYLYDNGNMETSVYALKNRLQNTDNQPASENVLSITGNEEFIDKAKQVFDDRYFWFWNEHLSEDVNLHYYAVDNNTKRELTNNDSLKNYTIENAADNYQILIQVDYDEYGEVTVESYTLSEEYGKMNWVSLFDVNARNEIENYIIRDTEYALYDRQEVAEITDNGASINQIKVNPINNMSFIFGVPSTMQKSGGLYYQSIENLRSYYNQYSVIYAAGFTAIVAILFLIFPNSLVREWNWFKAVSKIKAELLIPAMLFITILVLSGGINMVYITQEGNLYLLIEHLQLIEYLNELSAAINVIVWIAYFFMVMLWMFMIRFILHKGIIRYIKENTCLFWVIGLIGKFIQWLLSLVDRLLSFDLSDPINKTVFRIVLINFLIVSVICCFFVFGWFFAVIYSVIMFILIKKKLEKIQNDYLKLLDTANQISEGNFNVQSDEDAGIFNSLRDAFGEVKTGFEKAVNEEFKSQRMKTELISNVSHDLKTPLTSIITYVDLLKKEGLTEEERCEYINTIDRNSQRLKNLISDLFEISKANSGNVSLHVVEVDIVSLIRQVIFECQEKIEEAQLDFKLNFCSERIPLMLDSLKTYRIFENLVINICKYALNHTRVYVDVTETEHQVKAVFKNISTSELTVDPEEMTERFVQGDKSRNTEGSGLGLAIVKSFTQLQNGQFHIEVDGDLFKAIVIFNK